MFFFSNSVSMHNSQSTGIGGHVTWSQKMGIVNNYNGAPNN